MARCQETRDAAASRIAPCKLVKCHAALFLFFLSSFTRAASGHHDHPHADECRVHEQGGRVPSKQHLSLHTTTKSTAVSIRRPCEVGFTSRAACHYFVRLNHHMSYVKKHMARTARTLGFELRVSAVGALFQVVASSLATVVVCHVVHLQRCIVQRSLVQQLAAKSGADAAGNQVTEAASPPQQRSLTIPALSSRCNVPLRRQASSRTGAVLRPATRAV